MSYFQIVDDFRYNLGKKSIDLENDTFKFALLKSTLSSTHSAWSASTTITAGDVCIPTTRNGHRYIATVGGTADSSEPTWTTTDEGAVTDNTVTWQEYGFDILNLGLWANVSTHEVTNGDGYTTGGTIVTSTWVKTYRTTVFDVSDPLFSSLTKSFRWGVLYKSGTDNGIVSPIVGVTLFDSTFVDKVSSGLDFWTQIPTNGIMPMSRAA